jgi:UDP-N-acetylmuramate dehydrogenase
VSEPIVASGLKLEPGRPLAPLTTLGLGGPAAQLVQADTRETVREALSLAERESWPVAILGGGSNLVIADAGFPGLVLRMATQGIELTREGERATLTAQAGESWDDLVALAVREELAGIECLSGIPGSVGATPIQNVGAYGQEVSDVIDAVEVLDRADDSLAWLSASECAFGYRDSHFKRDPSRYVVLAVRFSLRAGAAPTLRHGELTRTLAARSSTPTLRDVEQAVRSLRANKGMLIEPGWPRSVGSFFVNPLVDASEAERVQQHARTLGRDAADMPRYPATDGRVKLSAAWLIEQAGIRKGLQRGPVGVSTLHALALVHYGGGSTRDLLALATEIQQQVDSRFGIRLQIEPVRWGI